MYIRSMWVKMAAADKTVIPLSAPSSSNGVDHFPLSSSGSELYIIIVRIQAHIDGTASDLSYKILYRYVE